MLKILLPVDFSESAKKTCYYALSLASTADRAQLLLLHSFHDYLADADTEAPLSSTLSPSETIAEQVIHLNEVEAQEKLDLLYNELLSYTRNNGLHVQLERAFIYGSPDDVIQQEINRYKPDLVMMGTVGESNIARAFFGTVTTEVALKSKAPVLTVPLHYNGRSLSKVLYATDFDKTDAGAIATLHSLLQPFAPNIICVHISTNGNQEEDSQRLEQLRQQLNNSIPGPGIRFELLKNNDVADTLQDFVEQENIDLVALTTRKRDLLDKILHPSLTKKLVLASKVPLLVFHSDEEV